MNRLLCLASCVTILCAACGTDSLQAVPFEQRNPPGSTNNNNGPDDNWRPANAPPQNQPPSNTCQTGALMGRLCLPGQDTALVNARVYLYATDCLGNQLLYDALSQSNGQFSLAGLPAGDHTLFIEHASLNSSLAVTVVAGQIDIVETTDPNAPLCLANAPPRLAVITGEYDSVDVVLDSLALTYDIYDSFDTTTGPSSALALLSDFNALTAYDVIFFTCGSFERDFMFATVDWGTGLGDESISFNYNAITYQNLQAFVLHGGDVYASDWAWPIAEGLNSNVIDFYGNEIYGEEVILGDTGGVAGQITDNALSLFLATTNVAIDYDLPGWAVIDSVTTQATVYMRGAVSASIPDPLDPFGFGVPVTLYDRPLLVGFRPYAGGGTMIYTTFHYHAQPNQQMIDVLRYLIFQL